jgi:hypothetical protein
MTLDDFWNLIDKKISPEQLEEADFGDLEAALAAMSPDEIQSFDDHFHRLHAESYSWKLWGAAYIINGGCSDDGFDYFRAWLIGKGRACFEAALADPESLVDQAEEDVECEDLMYIAQQAYQKVSGSEEMPGKAHSFPELGESWDFDDEDEMRKRYPRLCGKFF